MVEHRTEASNGLVRFQFEAFFIYRVSFPSTENNADMLYWLGRCSVKALVICRGEFKSHICNLILLLINIQSIFVSFIKNTFFYKVGRGEIRTPGSRVKTPRLKPGTLNHSVTRPLNFLFIYGIYCGYFCNNLLFVILI